MARDLKPDLQWRIFSVKMGKTPFLAAALQKQLSWPPSTPKEGGRAQPVCPVSRAPCATRRLPGHREQRGDPAVALALCGRVAPLDGAVRRATVAAGRGVNGGDGAGAVPGVLGCTCGSSALNTRDSFV